MAEIQQAPEEHYLLSQRDNEEADGLNVQSKASKCLRSNHILEEHIPKQSIRNIADVATGTGVWLRDVATELQQAGSSNVNLVGFDISDAQFPQHASENMKFILADINHGFAEEWDATFDIVHLRFLLVALTIEQIEPAVRNVLKLLKPDGYLQWDEVIFTKDPEVYYPRIDDALSLREEGEQVWSFCRSANFSLDLIGELRTVLEACPVKDVRVRDYLKDTYTKPELQPLLVDWYKATLPSSLRLIMLRVGKDEGEADVYIKECRRKIEEIGKREIVLPMHLATLTARRSV